MTDRNTIAETLTRERCYIAERVNDADIPEFSLCDCRVKPGVTTELHSLDVDEWYAIVEGTGSMQVDGGEPYDVGPGDIVSIPRHQSQRIRNTGEADLLFQCICIPRFRGEGYQALE